VPEVAAAVAALPHGHVAAEQERGDQQLAHGAPPVDLPRHELPQHVGPWEWPIRTTSRPWLKRRKYVRHARRTSRYAVRRIAGVTEAGAPSPRRVIWR
jgi:hypothetical protein